MNNHNRLTGLFFIFLILSLSAAEKGASYTENWPAWRGPLMTGESPEGNPPLRFGENEHVRWKIPVPGRGLSTPVIWENQIFLTTAAGSDEPVNPEELKSMQKDPPMWMRASGQAQRVEKKQRFMVCSVDRRTGKILWQNTVREQLPHEGTHKDGSWASPSCVTDGQCVVASFGSFGLYCFNMNGTLLWQKDFGDMQISNTFGEGSSPVLYGDRVILNWDHEGPSFLAVLDKKTGDLVWKRDRDEGTTWSTPLVVDSGPLVQIVISATGLSRGYDLADGRPLWQIGGMTGNVIPSPVYGNGAVFLSSGFRGNALQAILPEKAKGDIQGTDAVLWANEEKITSYVPSPLLYRGKLYMLYGNSEKLSCVDAATGEIHYSRQDLEGLKGVYASPVAAAGRIYVAGRNGAVDVIAPGPVFSVLAKNVLEDGFDASPAIAGKDLILRGNRYLYCIGE
ncbi:PQQ-binding-like beta-propeller repeat protein [bacterium]|nr:PQQ-binding-like beta-propeller repeat protein [bacterium]